MQNLRFENPEWLFLLILLPFLLYVYIRRRRFRQSSVRYSDVAVFNSLKAPPSIRLRHLLIGLKLLGIALLIVAMARPQAGRSKRQVSSDGIDIMLTLDV